MSLAIVLPFDGGMVVASDKRSISMGTVFYSDNSEKTISVSDRVVVASTGDTRFTSSVLNRLKRKAKGKNLIKTVCRRVEEIALDEYSRQTKISEDDSRFNEDQFLIVDCKDIYTSYLGNSFRAVKWDSHPYAFSGAYIPAISYTERLFEEGLGLGPALAIATAAIVVTSKVCFTVSRNLDLHVVTEDKVMRIDQTRIMELIEKAEGLDWQKVIPDSDTLAKFVTEETEST